MTSQPTDPGPESSTTKGDAGERPFPWLATAALASIGAGAVHGAAIGIHAEHPELARLFVVVTVAQLAAGVAALLRPTRVGAAALAAVNAAAVAAWLVTRLTGVSFVGGLETREAPQFTDTTCALLGAAAAGVALAVLLVGGHRPVRGRPGRLLGPIVGVAALTLPAMWVGSTHVHAHTDDGALAAGAHTHTADGSAASDAAAADPTAAGQTAAVTAHSHASEATPRASTPATAHTHGAAATASTATASTATGGTATPTTAHTHTHGTDAAVDTTWPRPFDPSKPIDLSGVPGVTAEQQARATKLIEDTERDLPRWADTKTAIADGYRSIGDAGTGSEHYIKYSLIEDDVILDPTQPESLVYTVKGDQRILAGAMFIASKRPTDDPSLTSWAGPLMTWHNHGNLCWAKVGGVNKVVGITNADGTCTRGVNTGGANPMVHVWITAQACGPFAALEGVGAGQAAVPESERVDMCTAAHHHGSTATSGSTPATPAASATVPATGEQAGATPTSHTHTADAAIVVHPYDPSLPIDLSGTPGVTAQQQAAAENIIAETVRRLPKWADYKVAEWNGFKSIGDGLTGTEHYIKWDWINDDVYLDPDHPESLVYEPQPDGSKKLVSAMYMLPDTVTLDKVPNIGGALMQWHIHDNLCFTTDPVAPRVAGVTNGSGNCGAGLKKFQPAPMIHVWIVANRCGPFAALEGVGAGQIKPGEERLCDHQHGDGLLG